MVWSVTELIASSLSFDGTAFRISPYIGFNWQLAPRWVTGIEGDGGFADRRPELRGLSFRRDLIPVTGPVVWH